MRKRPLRRQIEPEQETREIAIKAAHTLQQACALELLSFYMSAIASQQSQIGGTTDVMPHPLREYGRFLPRDQWHPGSVQVVPSIDLWKNTAVDSLASIIVDAGLVETIAEANLFVIPALFEYDLLPEELGKHELDNQPDKDKIYDSEPPESIPSFSDLPPPFLADSQGHGTIPSAVGERMTQRTGYHALDQPRTYLEESHDLSIQDGPGEASTAGNMHTEPKGKEKELGSNEEAEDGQIEMTSEVSGIKSPFG